MKVLNVNHLLDPESGGGTAERTFQLSRFFSLAGIQTSILTLDIGISKELLNRLGGVQLSTLPCINRRFFVPQLGVATISRLVQNADIVHLSGHWTVLNALVYRACRKHGKPFVFCPAGALGAFGRSVALKRAYDALIGKSLATSAAACVAITRKESADFQPYGVPDSRIEVIPNGIDMQQYTTADEKAQESFRGQLGLGQSPFILFLGRLNPIKGPDVLLEAFAKIANRHPHHLVFAGPDGGMRQLLVERSATLQLQNRVHFAGFVSGNEKIAALKCASFLAIPSRREAMSIVVLEAGASGTPVLFTDTCGLEELSLEDAGTMVGVSAQAIADGIDGMLLNPGKTAQSADRLHQLVKKQYPWSIQAQRYAALFSRILAES